MTRLLLVRHAPTAATRSGAFALDEPIEPDAAAAAILAAALPQTGVILSSPALRCRQTAAAVGLRPQLEPALAECDFGSWEGRTFAEITAAEPAHLIDGWLGDPDATPHGGESLGAFSARVAGWLAAIARPCAEPVVAFTHAGVVRAVVVGALAAPAAAFWRIAAEPLSITELRFDEGAWTLMRSNWTALG